MTRTGLATRLTIWHGILVALILAATGLVLDRALVRFSRSPRPRPPRSMTTMTCTSSPTRTTRSRPPAWGS